MVETSLKAMVWMASLRSSWVASVANAVWGETGGNPGVTWTVFLGMWKGMGSVGEHGGVDVGDLLDALME